MAKTIHTDRSRIETYQRCARLRWLEYHAEGTGIVPAKKPLPLAVGGSVHKGLETLLRWAMESGLTEFEQGAGIEDDAVAAALADFATHRSALAVDTTEVAAMASSATVTAIDSFDVQVAAQARELGMDPADPAIAELFTRQRNSAAEFESWLYAEQAALVEGLVRAYARRRLRPLLEEFEVLEVEREGDWELWRGHLAPDCNTSDCDFHDAELRFMSRPDALLRSRTDNSLYLLSFKTAATWDVRKTRDAEHDMQGLSEGVEVEKRLGEWWARAQADPVDSTYFEVMVKNATGELVRPDDVPSKQMYAFLRSLPAPPRILGIRYEYMLKGSRYADRDLAARFGLNVWAQRSHLVRAYNETTSGFPKSDAGRWCWAYEFLKDDGGTSKLYYKTWRPRAVWESMSIKSWIDLLDASEETMSAYDSTTGMEPRPLGWASPAQAQGYTATHPLDDVFPPAMTVYRSDDQLRDWVEQVEAQETRVAEAVAMVDAASDDGDGEKRHQLNVLFPMSRRACSYPTECSMVKVCYGGDDIRRDPLASEQYRRRVANHPQESGRVTVEAKDEI